MGKKIKENQIKGGVDINQKPCNYLRLRPEFTEYTGVGKLKSF